MSVGVWVDSLRSSAWTETACSCCSISISPTAARREGRLNNLSSCASGDGGAVRRLRPKFMTVATIRWARADMLSPQRQM